MKFVKKIYTFMIVLSAMVLFTACGKAKREDIADDLKGNLGMDASAGDVGKENETDGIPDNISYAVNVEDRIINVDAKVYADGYGNVPTFAAKECADREEWILNYAKKIFDNGEYKNVKSYELLNREELEEELQFYKERYAENDENNHYNATSYIEELLDNYNEEEHVSSTDQLIYSDEYFNEETEHSLVTNRATLRGYVDGRMWTLVFEDGYEDEIIDGEKRHLDIIPSLIGWCMDDMDEGYFLSGAPMDETYPINLCKRENAEKQAKDFLKQHGFDNMELLHIEQNKKYNSYSMDEYTMDGYTMAFGMSENGTHLLFGYEAGYLAMEPETDYAAVQPYVEVVVNSNGVCGITIKGIYDETEVMSVESKLLSFEKINEIAKEKFTEMLEKEDSVSFDIGSIEFGYVYITYDGLSYVAVPAWRYYDVDGGRDAFFRISHLTICALDGSIIYYSDKTITPGGLGSMTY
ncbi:MAG: hypothetical protein K2G45_10355 [Lachnospiraceae bacterium]|nr:hypothetical protein [Lachnospiraceae bacterium]